MNLRLFGFQFVFRVMKRCKDFNGEPMQLAPLYMDWKPWRRQ